MEMQLLSEQEQKTLQSNPLKYINILQRLDNLRLEHQIYRYKDEFVLKNPDFIVPTFENPLAFKDHIEDLFDVAFFGNELNFGAIPKAQYEQIVSVYDEIWREDCYLLYFDGKPFDALQDAYHIQDKIYIPDVLRLEDAPLIFENYMFKEDGIGYIEDIIKYELTFCFRVDGVPVSWVVQREDGSLGIMYTRKSYRRLGLGQILSRHLINRILEKGQTPYIHIHIENEPSLALASSLGFKRHSEVVWFGVKR